MSDRALQPHRQYIASFGVENLPPNPVMSIQAYGATKPTEPTLLRTPTKRTALAERIPLTPNSSGILHRPSSSAARRSATTAPSVTLADQGPPSPKANAVAENTRTSRSVHKRAARQPRTSPSVGASSGKSSTGRNSAGREEPCSAAPPGEPCCAYGTDSRSPPLIERSAEGRWGLTANAAARFSVESLPCSEATDAQPTPSTPPRAFIRERSSAAERSRTVGFAAETRRTTIGAPTPKHHVVRLHTQTKEPVDAPVAEKNVKRGDVSGLLQRVYHQPLRRQEETARAMQEAKAAQEAKEDAVRIGNRTRPNHTPANVSHCETPSRRRSMHNKTEPSSARKSVTLTTPRSTKPGSIAPVVSTPRTRGDTTKNTRAVNSQLPSHGLLASPTTSVPSREFAMRILVLSMRRRSTALAAAMQDVLGFWLAPGIPKSCLYLRQARDSGSIFRTVNRHLCEVSAPNTSTKSLSIDFCLSATQLGEGISEIAQRIAVPAVVNALNGKDTTIIVHGHKGAGKTSLCVGSHDSPQGLLPRVCAYLLSRLQERDAHNPTGAAPELLVQVLEVYLDQVYDLLATSRAPLRPRANQDGTYSYDSLRRSCRSATEVLRTVAEAAAPRGSSSPAPFRAHTIYVISHSLGGRATGGRIWLAQLAGAAQPEAMQLRESTAIASSVQGLANALRHARENRSQMPSALRETRLARLLSVPLIRGRLSVIGVICDNGLVSQRMALSALSTHAALTGTTLRSISTADSVSNATTITYQDDDAGSAGPVSTCSYTSEQITRITTPARPSAGVTAYLSVGPPKPEPEAEVRSEVAAAICTATIFEEEDEDESVKQPTQRSLSPACSWTVLPVGVLDIVSAGTPAETTPVKRPEE
eukprot:TRINITY_DN6399_c0_g1_i1.p1 TRINITY_DN6399_c0_g1~~TRINITY_DN6399_c0_g1_i1.p1  ORF type:complete len:892 (+),score=67.05 TRINITY_DN6399_c0_g1_i1:58-2676(+)